MDSARPLGEFSVPPSLQLCNEYSVEGHVGAQMVNPANAVGHSSNDEYYGANSYGLLIISFLRHNCNKHE